MVLFGDTQSSCAWGSREQDRPGNKGSGGSPFCLPLSVKWDKRDGGSPWKGGHPEGLEHGGSQAEPSVGSGLDCWEAEGMF